MLHRHAEPVTIAAKIDKSDHVLTVREGRENGVRADDRRRALANCRIDIATSPVLAERGAASVEVANRDPRSIPFGFYVRDRVAVTTRCYGVTPITKRTARRRTSVVARYPGTDEDVADGAAWPATVTALEVTVVALLGLRVPAAVAAFK